MFSIVDREFYQVHAQQGKDGFAAVVAGLGEAGDYLGSIGVDWAGLGGEGGGAAVGGDRQGEGGGKNCVENSHSIQGVIGWGPWPRLAFTLSYLKEWRQWFDLPWDGSQGYSKGLQRSVAALYDNLLRVIPARMGDCSFLLCV